MNKLSLLLLAIPLLGFMGSCAGSGGGGNATSADSVAIAETTPQNDELIMGFFKEFQENNDGWTKTTEGHQKLAKAFEEKMTSDAEFAKACASYNMESQYGSNSLRRSESISSYNKEDGEEGEVKAFDVVFEIPLIKPLYNGQKTIDVKFEIISFIPSTVEEHWRPYVKNANYCSTFDPYQKNSYDGALDLGCYVIAKKDK